MKKLLTVLMLTAGVLSAAAPAAAAEYPGAPAWAERAFHPG